MCNNSQKNLMAKDYGQHHSHVSGVIEWFYWGTLIRFTVEMLTTSSLLWKLSALFLFSIFLAIVMSGASNLFYQLPWSSWFPLLFCMHWELHDFLWINFLLTDSSTGLIQVWIHYMCPMYVNFSYSIFLCKTFYSVLITSICIAFFSFINLCLNLAFHFTTAQSF